MLRSTFITFLIFFTITGSILAQGELKTSQKAPSFMLKLFDSEKVVKSGDIFAENELTVLIIWDSYCGKCLAAVAECNKFYEESKKLNVGLWSINFDKENIPKARIFIKSEGIQFPVISDPSGIIAEEYGAKAYDFSFFIIDKNGIIRHVTYDHPPDIAEVIKAEVVKLLKERLKVSDIAPEFSLKTLDENKILDSKEIFSQKDLNLLVFWNSQSKKCLDTLMEIEKLHKKSERLNINVISINFDKDTEKAKYLIKKKLLTLTALSDPENSIILSYKAEDYCFSVFIIDNKGIVKYISYVPSSKIAKEIEGEITRLRKTVK